MFYGGKMHMLNQPEFHNVQKTRDYYGLLDESQAITSIFSENEAGIQIRIGSENKHIAMEDCSVITASYSIGEEQKGSIAI